MLSTSGSGVSVRKEFGMQCIKDILLLDKVLEVKPNLFSWRLLSDFPGKKISGSPVKLVNFQFSAWLIWRGLKQFNLQLF